MNGHNRGVLATTGPEGMGQMVPPRPPHIDGLRQVKAGIQNLVEDTLPNIDNGSRPLSNDLEIDPVSP